MSIFAATRTRTVAIVTAIGLVFGGLFLATPAIADTAPPDPTNPATPVTVSADVLPTPQIDGVVWAQVVVGNTVYVAGKFTTARPAGSAPGVNTVPRNNLLAYDVTTGVLISSFAPNLNAQALGITASPDGSRIYVVGDFTSIDGAGYYRIAAFNTATRTIIPSFRPIMESETRAVAASNTTVYTGGDASSVNGVARTYLAAVSATDGSTLGWTANADAPVDALVLTKDGSKLIVGGRFQNLGGVANYGLGAVDATTGAILPWAANQKVRDAGTSSSITALFATNDRIYGSGYVYGSGGNLEGIFSADPDTGNIQWIEDCHGDTYSVFATESVVYGAGHPHYCGNIGGFPQTSPTWTFHHSLAFSKAATGTITADPYGYFNWAGNPSPSLQDWFVNWSTGTFTGQGQATWSMAGNDKYLVVGGEFPSVSGVSTQGLARFAVPSVAPNKAGPGGIPLVPSAASFKAGQVRVGWTATYDGDNGYLTYKVYRDSGTTPVYQTTAHSNFYTRPAMGFVDSGLAPGIAHVYHVKVFDPFGNSTSRDTPSVTVAAQDNGGAYATGVTADGASAYWPLDEASGTLGFDHVGFTDLQLQSGVTRGAAGPLSGVAASTFDGTANGFAVTPSAITPPDTFTTETWIRTTTTTGGKIIGFGASNTGTSSSYDRHVYMDNAGKIWFGVYPGSVKTVNSTASYNDGQWHQIVASLGANGMRLYVDGKRVGSRTDVTAGQQYSGYWRVGGDNLNSWTSKPTSNFFKGDIGQVAIYPTVLGPTTIANHYVASGRPSPFPPAPADSYGAAVYNASPDLYWRLGESSGTTANDAGPFQSNGTYAGAVTLAQSGALSGVSNTSVKLTTSKTGSNWKGGTAASQLQYSNPTTYSLELWFSTTTTVGGKLIGFGSSQTGLSNTYDRHIYMQDNGKLVFGTSPGGTRNVITTPNSYNNGQWHHVVATQASDGMMLYVDGALVGTNPQTAAQAYNGYWRVGGDSTWGSTSPYFSGKLDEVAVYSSELSAQAVANHYSLGTAGVIPNQSPIAAFTSSAVDLTASFDGSTSSDSDGTVAGYAWDFGDGATGTGATTTHAYAAGGSYQVTLTVTDNQGATGVVTKTVAVTAPPPNQQPVAAFTSSAVNLAASFDGSTSSDPDGTVAGYAWDFGDGTTGTGATTTHTYGAAGTFTVALTVTDDKGATGSITHTLTVTAPPPNQQPVAAFTSSAVNLAASFDGSTSSDPDGTVAGYAWDFGDGTTGTGATTTHTYGAAGTFTVALTVTDDKGATGTVTHDVTVTAPPANQPPVAAFTSSVSNLTVSVNGSTSSDPDGTIASYAWDFGDGQTGAGATTSHAYAAAGTYTVTLTVTDNAGATNAKAASVTVTAPVANALAQDAFTRSVTGAWGSADIGGAWTLAGGSTNFLVGNGFGQQSAGAGLTRTATLPGVTSTNADVQATITTDKAATGGGIYVSTIGRLVGSTDYEARVWIKSTGVIQLQLLQGSTALQAVNLTGITYTPGSLLRVRVQVFGTSPTTIRAKVWAAAQAEPAAWQLSATDATAALQVAGSTGLRSYVSGTATDVPVAIRFDDFIVAPAQ